MDSVKKKVALISGITGQDGAYLASLLLAKGYIVHGSTRALPLPEVNNLVRLGIVERVGLIQLDPTCLDAVRSAIDTLAPSEIYNLAGQSSVGDSFKYPWETWRSIEATVVNWLEAIRQSAPHVRFFNAGSGECFGNVKGSISEQTPMEPVSPYAAAKTGARWHVSTYRETYSLHASTGILFNHESSLRESRFVTRKIVDGVKRIAGGCDRPLILGNLDVWRDWGWAPDYVEAMWHMLQHSNASDYVIGTGRCVSLQYFVELAFSHYGLDWREHVINDEVFVRPSDIVRVEVDASRIQRELGWQVKHYVEDVVKLMITETL